MPLCTSHPAAELEYVIENSQATVLVSPSRHWVRRVMPIHRQLEAQS